jgi:lipoyl(octanoyl) transferase
MALDELLMESQGAPSEAPPALRFYAWSEPSITVGYFQDPAAIARRFRCKEQGISVVKRLTGGGMVLHGKDLTASIALPSPNPFLPNEVKSSYLKVNEAFMAGLRAAYPGLDFAPCKDAASPRGREERICFENPSCYDLLLDGRKVVGSSQRRSGGKMLHQTTLFFERPSAQVIEMVLEGLRKCWGAEFEERPFGEAEIAEAEKIAAARYASPEWVFRAASFLR